MTQLVLGAFSRQMVTVEQARADALAMGRRPTRRGPYFPTLPKRCAGGEPGLGGACLACGVAGGELCQAPPADRYRSGRR